MKNILISNPTKLNSRIYLPYIWGLLKTATEQDIELKRGFNWLPPIFKRKNVDEYLDEYKDHRIDVLGLSCYLWNVEFNYKLAKAVKERSPRCLVIAGGPEVVNDGHNFIDVIVYGAGETSWVNALKSYLNNETIKELSEVVPDINVSPYLSQAFYYEKMVKELREEGFIINAILDSARGCPFNCAFCTEKNKTQLINAPLSRVKQEINFLSELRIKNIFNIACNFGAFKTDEDILDHIIEKKKKSGYPTRFFFHVSKNTVKRNIRFAIKYTKAGLMTHHAIGIQHTDPEILNNINRINPSIEEQKETIHTLHTYGIPSCCQIIMGLPGDTLENWCEMFYVLMKLNMDELRLYLLDILNNTPMAEPDYMNKWGIRTITKITNPDPNNNDHIYVPDGKFTRKISISSNTYTIDDWKDMYIWASYVQALHFSGLIKHVSMYLYHTHKIEYKKFYEYLYKDFKGSQCYKDCHDHLKKYLAHTETFKEIKAKETGKFYPLEQYIMIQLILHQMDKIFIKVLNKYNYIPQITDIVKYQKDINITFDYDRRNGKIIKSRYNFKDYFKKLFTFDKVTELKSGNYKWFTNQQSCGVLKEYPLDWLEVKKSSKSQINLYLKRVVGIEYTQSKRLCFTEEELNEID